MNKKKPANLPTIDNLIITEKDLGPFKEGNYFTWKTVYNKYSGPIQFIASQMVGKEIAEDVKQEVIQKLYENREKIYSMASINEFIKVTCRNKCIDILRKKAVSEKAQNELFKLVKEFDEKMEQYTFDIDVMSSLSIEGLLNDKEQSVLTLILKEKSTEEIAESMGIAAGTVYNIKSRAIKKIRRYYRNNTDF